LGGEREGRERKEGEERGEGKGKGRHPTKFRDKLTLLEAGVSK